MSSRSLSTTSSAASTVSSTRSHYLHPSACNTLRCPGKCKRSLAKDTFTSPSLRSQPTLEALRYMDYTYESEVDDEEDELSRYNTQHSFGSVIVDHDKLTARSRKKGDNCKLVKLTGWFYRATGKVAR
ncbi:hypothetical protein EJ05DRAFT_503482 [Pseudovirgaria hyperparasitica]|uniref:Uncharacterized protein n=1 Tax=Pseudovirgaria hyperparasitica TaxID=470096 RepID=A0A6A6W0S7_9PEZI|nr:uncharacterized protein EJ05DRAFT_503482 [Pseudovirgaria hyperparasitica]KAF2755177.1 hypothetical protein EJ05DRAFT_503482 [Pseudovirgaria hyperparasitica]